MSQTPDWIKELPQSVSAWFETIMDDGPIWGRFKDCVDAKLPYYLTATGCATYTIEALNVPFPGWTPDNLKARAEWALPMQDEETTFFIDEELEKLLRPEIASSPVELANFRRTVTRKTMVFVERGGVSPRFPVHYGGSKLEPDPDPEVFMQKIRALNWSNPWGACSQTSKLLGALYNEYIAKGREEYIPAFKRGLDFLLTKQNPETGLWGDSSMPVGVQVSGTYKAVGSTFSSYHLPLPRINKMTDSVLESHYSGALYADAPNGAILYPRNNVDLAIMIDSSSDYRKEELRTYIESVADEIRKYRQPDGAFSSDYTGKMAIGWCGTMVSDASEKPRSNINGTEAALVTLGSIADALGWDDYPMMKYARTLKPEQPDSRPYRVILDEHGKVDVVKR